MITDLIQTGLAIIDKVIPDAKAREEAKVRLLEAQHKGELGVIEAQLSAIIAEAQSKDPFTSRARPSFLYVVYILLLSAIPMGVVYAYSPDTAADITKGFKDWLSAIPEPIITLFGVGYLGYTGARTLDKWKA